jgi:hypothetical protein
MVKALQTRALAPHVISPHVFPTRPQAARQELGTRRQRQRPGQGPRQRPLFSPQEPLPLPLPQPKTGWHRLVATTRHVPHINHSILSLT